MVTGPVFALLRQVGAAFLAGMLPTPIKRKRDKRNLGVRTTFPSRTMKVHAAEMTTAKSGETSKEAGTEGVEGRLHGQGLEDGRWVGAFAETRQKGQVTI